MLQSLIVVLCFALPRCAFGAAPRALFVRLAGAGKSGKFAVIGCLQYVQIHISKNEYAFCYRSYERSVKILILTRIRVFKGCLAVPALGPLVASLYSLQYVDSFRFRSVDYLFAPPLRADGV